MTPPATKVKKHFKTGGYSREFTPRGKGKGYNLVRIPLDLWTDVRRKAKAEHVSLRSVILSLLREWVGKKEG